MEMHTEWFGTYKAAKECFESIEFDYRFAHTNVAMINDVVVELVDNEIIARSKYYDNVRYWFDEQKRSRNK